MKKLAKEEAAKVLEDMKVKIEIPKAAVTQWKRNTALDMAIEALKCSEVPNGSDCISRQAVIDALDKRFDSIPMEQTTEILLLRKDLRELPSAEPKRETATVSVGMSKGGVTMWYECAACGEPVDQGDTFCSGCGRRLIHE